MKVAKQCRKKIVTGPSTVEYLTCVWYKAPDYRARFAGKTGSQGCANCILYDEPIRDIKKCNSAKYK
jgi:hypothetical protein